MLKDERNIATILFYTPERKILLQDRKSISKFGEGWGPFGGSVEEGEFPEEAIKREIMEELEFELKDFRLLNRYNLYVNNLDGTRMKLFESVYISPFPGFDKLTLREGDGMELFEIGEVRKLKIQPLYQRILNEFEDSTNP